MNIVTQGEFKVLLLTKPATTIALGLILLACRQENKIALSEVMVYISRDFGSDFLSEWIINEVDPLLKPDECRWMWSAIHREEA